MAHFTEAQSKQMSDFILRLRFMCEDDKSEELRNVAAMIDREFPNCKKVSNEIYAHNHYLGGSA